MLLALLLACHVETPITCEHTTREVDDDTVLGDLGVTVAEIVAPVLGSHTFALARPDSSRTEGALTLARGALPASFTDTTRVEGEPVLKSSLFEEMPLLYIECEDRVSVPVDTTFSTADGAIAAAGTAELGNERGDDAETLSIRALAADGTLLPLEDGDPPDGETALQGRFEAGDLFEFLVYRRDETLYGYAGAAEDEGAAR